MSYRVFDCTFSVHLWFGMCVKCNYSVTRKSSVLLILFVQSCVRENACSFLLLFVAHSTIQNMIGTKDAFHFTFFMLPSHFESIKCHRVQIGRCTKHCIALGLHSSRIWHSSSSNILLNFIYGKLLIHVYCKNIQMFLNFKIFSFFFCSLMIFYFWMSPFYHNFILNWFLFISVVIIYEWSANRRRSDGIPHMAVSLAY